MSLTIHDLNFAYSDTAVLKQINVEQLKSGSLTVLLGPNAAGKSTFFKSIAGLVNADYQSILVDENELLGLSTQQRAELVCYMPQEFSNNAVLTVFDVVLLAYKQFGSWSVSQQDVDAVSELLAMLNISHLAERNISDLSGGQQQLVSLCQALSRDSSVFLLDEPTSALDLHYQHHVMTVLKQQVKQRDITCIVALHDLSLAASYADHVLLMKEGQLIAQGDTAHVFESPLLAQTYNVEIELLKNQYDNYVVSSALVDAQLSKSCL